MTNSSTFVPSIMSTSTWNELSPSVSMSKILSRPPTRVPNWDVVDQSPTYGLIFKSTVRKAIANLIKSCLSSFARHLSFNYSAASESRDQKLGVSEMCRATCRILTEMAVGCSLSETSLY